MVWGNNVVISNPDCYKGEPFSVALDAGGQADRRGPPADPGRGPGRHLAPAAAGHRHGPGPGDAHVIVQEELYDKEFVENYVHGWEPFVERVNEYPLEKVERITWVPREKIREAARLFAPTKPAAIQWGVAIEQQNQLRRQQPGPSVPHGHHRQHRRPGRAGALQDAAQDPQRGPIRRPRDASRRAGGQTPGGGPIPSGRAISPSSIPSASGTPSSKKSPIR